MTALKRLVLASALAAGAFAAETSGQNPPPPGCGGPEHRQFDFWLGQWEVVDAKGTVLGTNTITSVQNGCAITERWVGADGSSGTSLNFYDRSAKEWFQAWMSGNGTALRLAGGLRDGSMVLRSAPTPSPKGTVVDRIAWTPLAAGRVRQLWDRTVNGGQIWTVVFDGTYVRKGSR